MPERPLPLPPALPDKLCPSMQGPYASVSPDGALVALLGPGEVQIRDTATGKLRGTISYPGLSTSLAWLSDSRRLVIPDDTNIAIWNRSTASLTRIRVGKSVSVARPSPDGSRILAIGDNAVTLLHIEGNNSPAAVEIKLPVGSAGRYPYSQWVASGKVFAISDLTRKEIQIYDGVTGKLLREVVHPDLMVNTMKPSPTKDHLAVAETSAKIRIVDVHSGAVLSQSYFLGTTSAPLLSFSWDPAGERIAFLSSGATIELGIWNAYKGAVTNIRYSSSYDAVSWNNDGTRIGIWSRSAGVSIIDVSNLDVGDENGKGRILFPPEGQSFDGVWTPDMSAVLKTYDKRWESPPPPDYLDGRLAMVEIDTNRERFQCPTREPVVDQPDSKVQKASSRRKRKS